MFGVKSIVLKHSAQEIGIKNVEHVVSCYANI